MNNRINSGDNDAVLYVRVSSKEQAEGHFSIPAQTDFLKDYAKRQGFKILNIYQESESAKEKGRPVFDEMIKFLKKRKKTCRLLVEKNDRLLRNEDDAALTINIATKTETEIHLVKDNMVLSKRSTPHEIMIYTIMCATSSWYPRNLSLEVKKGMDKKAEMGYYPAKAPVGYENVRKSKTVSTIEVVPEKAHFVKRAFILYATGGYSYQSLADKLAEEGFIIKTRRVQKNNIEKILKNPFYMGDFNYKTRRCFDGKHKAIISKSLFNDVQREIERKSNPKNTKNDFVYSGLIKCEKCGSYLVGDLKKGKYLYFRCMNRNCDVTKHLKAEQVDLLVEDLLERLNIPDVVAKSFLENLKKSLKDDYEFKSKALEGINSNIAKIRARMNKLYIDKIDGVIDEEFYFEKKNEWETELNELLANQQTMAREDEDIMDRAQQMLELSKRASYWYHRQDNQKKRIFLKLVCSNFTWNGKDATMTIKKALKIMFEKPLSNMVGVSGRNSNFSEVISILQAPETVIFIDKFRELIAA